MTHVQDFFVVVVVVVVVVVRWSTAPAVVNAFYSATKNQISESSFYRHTLLVYYIQRLLLSLNSRHTAPYNVLPAQYRWRPLFNAAKWRWASLTVVEQPTYSPLQRILPAQQIIKRVESVQLWFHNWIFDDSTSCLQSGQPGCVQNQQCQNTEQTERTDSTRFTWSTTDRDRQTDRQEDGNTWRHLCWGQSSEWNLAKAPFTRYNRLSNLLYRVYEHSTGCQTRLTTGLTTGCIV